MVKKKIGGKSLTTLFIDDFEIQNWKLMENTKVELSEKSKNIFALYTLDFLLCYAVVGKAGILLL